MSSPGAGGLSAHAHYLHPRNHLVPEGAWQKSTERVHKDFQEVKKLSVWDQKSDIACSAHKWNKTVQMLSLLIIEGNGLMHMLHPPFTRATISSAYFVLSWAGLRLPELSLEMDIRDGSWTTGAISKKSGPKRQGKPPDLFPLPHHH